MEKNYLRNYHPDIILDMNISVDFPTLLMSETCWNLIPNHLGWCWNPINNGIPFNYLSLNWGRLVDFPISLWDPRAGIGQASDLEPGGIGDSVQKGLVLRRVIGWWGVMMIIIIVIIITIIIMVVVIIVIAFRDAFHDSLCELQYHHTEVDSTYRRIGLLWVSKQSVSRALT